MSDAKKERKEKKWKEQIDSGENVTWTPKGKIF
jgi:hypothetical protein